MKIVSLKCPECGASLNIEQGMKMCFCSHCGTQIMLDDEAQKVRYTFDNADEAGYQFEQGRMRAQFESPGNMALAEKIQELIQPISDLENLNLRSQTIRHSLSESENQYKKVTSPLIAMSYYWVPAVVAVLAIFMAFSGESFSIFLFGALFAVGLYFAIKKVLELYRFKLSGDIDSKTAELNQTRDRVREIYDNNDFNIVAEEYQNSDALNFFYKSLVSGRALNMNQAVLLYEDHLKDEETRRFQQRQIELQQQQLEALRNGNNSSSNMQESETKPNTAATIAAVGGALYAGAKFMKELNKRKK